MVVVDATYGVGATGVEVVVGTGATSTEVLDDELLVWGVYAGGAGGL